MTGQCSELILLIWSVWSGYRAIRVLYLPSSPIPSSLSQYSLSPSLSLTINNITTSDNHTASYRTSHTQPHHTSLTSLYTLFCPPYQGTDQSSVSTGTMVDFKYSVILLWYQQHHPRQKQFSAIQRYLLFKFQLAIVVSLHINIFLII